jgi:membrane-bound lytic murein transglycosylase F
MHRRAPVLAVVAICLTAGGCQERIEGRSPATGTGIPAIPHPIVERDLEEIARSGVIRMITTYNSSSYFIHRGGQAGFDYELLWWFAREHDLTVEVIIPEQDEDPVSLLNAGAGDLICAGLAPDPRFERFLARTRPTNFVSKVLVLPEETGRPPTLAGMAGLTITLPRSDPFREDLLALREEARLQFFVSTARPHQQAEDLVTEISQGRLQAAVVDDIIARSAMTYLPNLTLGPVLGDRRPNVWYLRENSPDLKAALNRYLKDHLYVSASGRPRRSETYGIIYDRYFSDETTIKRFQEAEYRPDKSGVISAFDELIREKAEAAGLDWRMVASLIYQESQFHPGARSKADARGLMQVLPRFAGEQADSLFLPEPNLTAGLRLLKRIHASYAYMDSLNRWRFTLAEYHAGHGHLTDARRLAMDMGRDPNSWENGMVQALPLLMDRRHHSGTRHGYYGGAKTVDYVEEILNRCRMYIRLVDRQPAPDRVPWPPPALEAGTGTPPTIMMSPPPR